MYIFQLDCFYVLLVGLLLDQLAMFRSDKDLKA